MHIEFTLFIHILHSNKLTSVYTSLLLCNMCYVYYYTVCIIRRETVAKYNIHESSFYCDM